MGRGSLEGRTPVIHSVMTDNLVEFARERTKAERLGASAPSDAIDWETLMKDRKEQEAEFHDHLRHEFPFQRYSLQAERELGESPEWSNFKFYSIERKSRAYADEWIRSRCYGKRVLDYGCGNGADTIFAARNGAHAVGIDISPVSIDNCRRNAAEAGVADRTEYHMMDAEALTFEDNSFDLVVVYGVLHHLQFAKAMTEISRVLRPDGAAICTEALGHNPLIRAYRRRTPNLRTEWETNHILRRENIRSASRWFGRVKPRFRHLATIAAVPLRRTRSFGLVLSALELLDAAVLRIPGLRWQAWQVVLELAEPIKTSRT